MAPAKSTPKSSPIKIWHVKSLPSEKRVNFRPPRYKLNNLAGPDGNNE